MPIYLIRHGETDSNAARVLQTPEVPLSRRGREQAARLAQRLASAGVERIVTSDLERAVMTAQALAGATGAPVDRDPLLQERNFGDLRGTAYADLTCDPFAPGYAPPGGESERVFDERVDRAWQRVQSLAAQSAGALAVVTHGLVCHSVVSRHLDAPARLSTERMRFANTALTVIEGPDPWRIERLACVAHLDEVAQGGEA